MSRELRAPASGAGGGANAAVVGGGAGGPPDEYKQRLYKLIPAEFTAAYVAVASLIASQTPGTDPTAYDIYYFGTAGVLLVTLPFYLRFVQGVHKPLQVIMTTLCFPIWVSCVSTDQLTNTLHNTFNVSVPGFLFSIVLILWTTLTPLFVR